MIWPDNNPLGVALASACGLIVLVSVGLAYVWSRPASSGASAPNADLQAVDESRQLMNELGPITEYREVTARPVFDESRRPMIAIAENGVEIEDDPSLMVAGAPEVSLSGVVITPELSLVTLKPKAGGESIIAYEGKQLGGDYVGWAVVDIEARQVVLASTNGDELVIDLLVNDQQIEAPIKPEPSAGAGDSTNGSASESSAEGQPLSRAEEIRQRIAERREELRRQAETESTAKSEGTQKLSKYQSAIRNMIKSKNVDSEEQEEKSDDGSDG